MRSSNISVYHNGGRLYVAKVRLFLWRELHFVWRLLDQGGGASWMAGGVTTCLSLQPTATSSSAIVRLTEKEGKCCLSGVQDMLYSS